MPWEEEEAAYPHNLATPLEIVIGASDGASDYGNKFGEPVIIGFSRSFGQKITGTEEEEDQEGATKNQCDSGTDMQTGMEQ